MATQQLTSLENYIAAFDSLENDCSPTHPWVQGLRKSAFARFNELGFPTARRGNEEWKYTDIRPIARRAFRPATQLNVVDLAQIHPYNPGHDRWHLAVFVDGKFNPQLSFLDSRPNGARVESIASVLSGPGSMVEQHVARYASYDDNAFAALNTAFLQDGAFIHLDSGTILEEPIHLLFITTTHDEEIDVYPRVLVLTGRDASASIIESHVGLSNGIYLSNAVTEIVLGAGASLRYYKMQRHSEKAYHVTNTEAVLARDSYFSSVNIDLGGGLVRNNLNARMTEEGASTMLNGLYMVSGTQHVDNQVIIEHIKGNTTANELYKGILDGKSRSVFHGSIIVREDAKGVNAYQVDKNLLLSKDAEADTKPAFWVYTDDVRCGHGAACGQIDDDAMFYLRSRGMDEITARNFVIHGFVAEVIDSIKQDQLRDHISGLVHSKLEDWLIKSSPEEEPGGAN